MMLENSINDYISRTNVWFKALQNKLDQVCEKMEIGGAKKKKIKYFMTKPNYSLRTN
jgi:hypothetical protein